VWRFDPDAARRLGLGQRTRSAQPNVVDFPGGRRVEVAFQGYIIDGKDRRAFLNGKLYRVGDQLEDLPAKIVAIEAPNQEKVELEVTEGSSVRRITLER
jgi:hypothetical protein